MKIVYLAVAATLLILPHTTKADDETKRLIALQAQVQSVNWGGLTQLVVSSPDWPTVPSSFEAAQLSGESKVVAELKINLVDILRKRILKQSKSSITGEREMDNQTLDDLVALSKRLRQVGGYGNYVVANFCSEIVFYDLSGRVVRKSKADTTTDQLLKFYPERSDWKLRLKSLAQADPFLADKMSMIDQAVSKESLVEAFMELGLGLADAGTLYGRRANNYGDMLRGNYVLDLLYSTAITEKAFLIGLRGTIDYVKSGGYLDNIKNFRSTQYLAIFKRSTATYTFPPLGVRSLSPDDIGYLISIHSDPRIREAFQTRLLN
jgi:hypothetical protein